MNVLSIVEATLALVQASGNGIVAKDAGIALLLENLVKAGMKAYADHTGEPMNVDLIKEE